jgi:hypothetical protein
LQSTEDTFKDAGDTLTQHAYDALLYELNGLLGFSTFLDAAISITEERLDLGEITASMAKVHSLMPSGGPAQNPDLARAVKDLSRSVEILRNLQHELEWRVREHGQLQALDSLLRTVCKAPPAAKLAKQWQKVKQLRSRLMPRLCHAWQGMSAEMESTETNIETSLERGDEVAARGFLNEYFYDVSSIFLAVDSNLKRFVVKLERINPVLDALLSSPENGSVI